jgi:predicted metalloprotease with PDZ domain
MLPLATPVIPAVHYQVEIADLHAHLFRVTLTIPHPSVQQAISLPVWIPGSYLIREFSRHLQKLQCAQDAHSVQVQQTDKTTWLATCNPNQPLQVQYEVYAFDTSVRTAWLDASRGFFNGTSLCLRAIGHEHLPHQLCVPSTNAPKGWQLATGLTPLHSNSEGFGLYAAENYDALVDCPVEMGRFWTGYFVACGIPHRFVVAGAPPTFDGQKLLDDTRAICEAEIHFWHAAATGSAAPPFSSYLFMLNAVPDGYGGLEHRNSTALICGHKDLPRLAAHAPQPTPAAPVEGYTTLLGLISHEYFHTWNVKRLRPAEFTRYHYDQENYTQLLWFFEGFTSYYDDLLLLRSKRIDTPNYLRLLTKTLNQVQQTPGRRVQTVAQSSFDAWVKYYRQDENTANATVSYYTKGALVALCLDLTLRSEGHTDLDAVMRTLWQHCSGAAMTEQDLATVVQQLSGRSFAKELADWVHSTQDLPVVELLELNGIQVHHEPNQLAQHLGLRVKDKQGLHIHQVLRGGAAENAGFASGDEWLAVHATSDTSGTPWRITSLDDIAVYCGNADRLQALICRDKRLHTLTLTLPPPSTALRLSVRDAATADRWLQGLPLLLPTSTPV